MVDPERREQTLGELVNRYRYLAIGSGAIAAVGLIAVVVYLIVGGGSEPMDLALATTSARLPSSSPAAPTTPDAGDLAGVSPVDCDPLITSIEVEEALAIRDRPSGEQGSHGLSIHETCTEQLDSDPAYFVRIEPGNPSDFDAGAMLIGVAGEPVADVGDEALWFGGAAADGGGSSGVLSVGQDTPIGLLQFRIRLGRPDLDSAGQLEIAKSLALAALHRFPGTPPGPPAPVVDLCALVTDEEAEAILGPYRGTHPGTLAEVMATHDYAGTVDLSRPGDASCTKLILTEIYVRITQGSDTDFDAGAEIGGVIGERVEGIGEAAVWFDGVPYTGGFSAPHDEGILSVRQGTALFHVVVALPDTPPDQQLEIAKGLARNALARIPGLEPPASTLTKPEPVELPIFGYVDNIDAKVESGEWTQGEGLLRTLKLFAGEIDPPMVLPDGGLIDYSGSGVIELAQSYLDTDTDEKVKAEITLLLDFLAPSIQSLREQGAIGSPEASGGSLMVALGSFMGQQVGGDRYCQDAYEIDNPCLVPVALPDNEAEWPGRYKLYRPISDVAGGWTLEHIDFARAAVYRSAQVFEPLKGMPRVTVLLGPYEDAVYPDQKSDECVISIGPDMQGRTEGPFKQRLALYMAYCLLYGKYEQPVPWWGSGLGTYLAGVAYPDVNLEHKAYPNILANEELSTTLMERKFTNWALFEFLHPLVGGEKGVIGLVDNLPSSINSYYHRFAQALTDARVADIGPKTGLVPYGPQAWRLDITGATEFSLAPPPYGVRRLHAVVSPGKYACLFIASGGSAKASWRPGMPGVLGDWTDDVPDIISGESIFLVTATGSDGRLDFVVEKVVDKEEDCTPSQSTTTTAPYNKPDICLDCGDSGFYFKKRN